jgi:hypothetical protein
VVKAGVAQLQAAGLLPIQPTAHGICRLPVRQPVRKLQHRDHGQAPGGLSRLPTGREESGEVVVTSSLSRVPSASRHWTTSVPRGKQAHTTRAVSSGTAGMGRTLSDMV